MTYRTLQVLDVIEGTSVDGPGLRTSIYLAGCGHHCPGCHNPQSHPFDSGKSMTYEELYEIVDRNGFNVTLSGGDPLYQSEPLIPFLKELKIRGYNIWVYTGFTLEEIVANRGPKGSYKLLNFIDALVDGPFIESLRDTSLRFRGSSNQRIIYREEWA